MRFLLYLSVILFLCVGCATSSKVQIVQIGDDQLSCQQISEDFKKLDRAAEEVKDKKGITGTNVAAVLFWIPGLIYTYYDAGEALEAIENRRSHLTTIYNKKECK